MQCVVFTVKIIGDTVFTYWSRRFVYAIYW